LQLTLSGKVKHCAKLNDNLAKKKAATAAECHDPLQFFMSAKSPAGKASMTSPYEYATQNRYAIRTATKPDIMQCSVAFLRSTHNEVEARVTDWNNVDKPLLRTAGSTSNTKSSTLTGLPDNLVVKMTGAFGTELNFEYGTAGTLSHYKWTSKSYGAGRGVDGSAGKYNNFCKSTKGKFDYDPAKYPKDSKATLGIKMANGQYPKSTTTATQQDVEYTKCWFPCFKAKI
jgi:hypothetical protein